MKHLRSSLIVASLAFALPAASNAQTTATTDPVGFVTVGITPGTGTAKKTTLFSIPLQESETITGQVAGTITGVTSNTIVNTNAGWSPTALSVPATPYIIEITSGSAQGRIFLIASSAATGGAVSGTANTADTVTISSVDSAQVNLTNIGVAVGNQYKIYACDTVSSFFGTPASTGILGGTALTNADSFISVVNGVASTYYFNTASNRWTKNAFGNPDGSNVPLPPYYGITFSRLPTNTLSFVVTGQVPVIQRQTAIKNSGTVLLSQFWPTATTLSNVGLQNIPGWVASTNVATADTVILTAAGVASTYFYNGTNWKKNAFGTPTSDTNIVDIGTTLQITKKGSAANYSTLTQAVPYSLQ